MKQYLRMRANSIDVIHTVQAQTALLALGRYGSNFKRVMPEYLLRIDKFMSTSCEIALMWIPRNTFDEQCNIGSGNGLIPPGNKALPEPILPQILPFHVTKPDELIVNIPSNL